jgi:lysyl endopeptidase
MKLIRNRVLRRSWHLMPVLALYLLLLVTQAIAQIEVDTEIKPREESLVVEAIPVSVQKQIVPKSIDVTLEEPDLTEVLRQDEIISQEKGRRRIGINRLLPTQVTVLARQSTKGTWVDLGNEGDLWLLTIQSQGALAIRIHLGKLQLPNGAQITVYNTENPQESSGPYDLHSLPGQEDFWTGTVFAARVTVECYVPQDVDANEVGFEILEINHVYWEFSFLLGLEGNCHNDATCFPCWSLEARAVSRITFIEGGSGYLCSGCLLNDFDPRTWEDYFLTANHCVGTQTVANTVEWFWLYQTSTCNGRPPSAWSVTRTIGGADLLASSSGNDFSFMRIRNTTPGGLAYAGWTTGTPGGSDPLACIHHPGGAFKRISYATRVGANSNFWTVRYYSGSTEGGSSGSPIIDPQHHIIGQLCCGDAACDNMNGTDRFGRFNVTFPKIRRWLEIGGSIHVDGTYSGEELGTPTKPFNTVAEANNFAWDGAGIKIQSGCYPERLTFSKKLTLIASGGNVTIGTGGMVAIKGE